MADLTRADWGICELQVVTTASCYHWELHVVTVVSYKLQVVTTASKLSPLSYTLSPLRCKGASCHYCEQVVTIGATHFHH